MKTRTTGNTVLALVGLLALGIYILACTSFSPDDTKVLYPAFDGPPGAVGVAMYDRVSARSEMLFLPVVFDASRTNAVAPQLLRAQWLPDGRRVLIAWAGGKDQDELHLALTSVGARAPVKLFFLPGVKDALPKLVVPLPVAGDRVFVMGSPTEVARLDLRTGTLERRKLAETDKESEINLYPVPGGSGVFYLEEKKEPPHSGVFGRLDPDRFTRTPLVEFTNEVAEGSFFTYNPQGTRLAFLEKAESRVRLVILSQSKATFTRPLGEQGEELAFGSAVFSSKGDLLLASFQRKAAGQTNASYGLMEIPLSSAPIRRRTLIPAAEVSDEIAALYFQAALSHDGKTAAVASTYVACAAKDFKPEDCALFLVDLTDPKRKVSKVPVPLPAQRAAPVTK